MTNPPYTRFDHSSPPALYCLWGSRPWMTRGNRSLRQFGGNYQAIANSGVGKAGANCYIGEIRSVRSGPARTALTRNF